MKTAILTYAGEIDGALRGEYTSRRVLRTGVISYSARRLALASLGLGMLYGLCMGSYAVFRGAEAPGLQVLASTLKVPMLFLLTLGVTFPSLYVFSALAGSRLTARGTLRLLVIAITVNLAVLAGFGPVVAFFTSCTESYPFIKLLNVAMFGVAGVISLVFLRRSLTPVFEAEGSVREPEGEEEEGPIGSVRSDRRAKRIFLVWLFVYGVVGAQMGWVLRPFIGTPSRPFEWFRDRESNFFENVIETFRALLS